MQKWLFAGQILPLWPLFWDVQAQKRDEQRGAKLLVALRSSSLEARGHKAGKTTTHPGPATSANRQMEASKSQTPRRKTVRHTLHVMLTLHIMLTLMTFSCDSHWKISSESVEPSRLIWSISANHCTCKMFQPNCAYFSPQQSWPIFKLSPKILLPIITFFQSSTKTDNWK